MVHHCITPFNVKSLCLNSILIHLYTNIKVNNDWEANHMQALYINFPLNVGDFIGGWASNTQLELQIEHLFCFWFGAFLFSQSLIGFIYVIATSNHYPFLFLQQALTSIYLSKYRIISNSYFNNNFYSYTLYVCS